MEPEESVLERLIGIPESYAALEGRIWLHKREQSSAYPCARVGLVTDSSRYHLRGGSNTGTAFVQVDVWAEEAGASDPYASARLGARAGPGMIRMSCGSCGSRKISRSGLDVRK
jgi:hypothetical protein